jgi:N-acyl homoserine lactone hydrolase
MFECGTLKCNVENIKMNEDLGEECEVPVPGYLIAGL